MKQDNSRKIILLLGICFFIFFALGELFPDFWWATHFIHFLPPVWKFSIFILAGLSLVAGFLASGNLIEEGINKVCKFFSSSWWLALVALIMGLIFYHFSMIEDYYGEAYLLNSSLLHIPSTIPQAAHDDLFNFGIAPWDGQKTIFALLTYISYFAQINYKEAFLWFDAFFGVLFVFTWLSFLRYYLSNNLWKIILSIAGLSAPFMLNFYGHIEVNAPIMWLNTTWLILALSYTKSPSTKRLFILLIWLIISIKFHAVAILYVPILIMLALYHYTKSVEGSFSWKKLFQFMLTPIYLIGAIFYFFIFQDFNDSRQLENGVKEFDRLFLPLVSPEAPLDKYNMLSFNHFFDYFSEILIWSPVALFLLVLILLLFRKKIAWQSLDIKIAGISLLLFASLFFVTNPLLSMPMDWDLFSFPAPLFLVFVTVLVKQIQNTNLAKRVLFSCFALTLLSVPILFVHNSKDMLSQRLVSTGIHVYHTYYEWSSRIIHYGLGITYEDRNAQLERKNEVLNKLQPFALEGIDRQYAMLWSQEGEFFFRAQRDYIKAIEYHSHAEIYNPRYPNTLLHLAESYLATAQHKKAYEYSQKLLRSNQVNKSQALKLAIHSALEATFYDRALLHVQDFEKTYGVQQDQIMREVLQRLQNKDRVGSLKHLFTPPD